MDLLTSILIENIKKYMVLDDFKGKKSQIISLYSHNVRNEFCPRSLKKLWVGIYFIWPISGKCSLYVAPVPCAPFVYPLSSVLPFCTSCPLCYLSVPEVFQRDIDRNIGLRWIKQVLKITTEFMMTPYVFSMFCWKYLNIKHRVVILKKEQWDWPQLNKQLFPLFVE